MIVRLSEAASARPEVTGGLVAGLPYVTREPTSVLFSPYVRKMWEVPSSLIDTPKLQDLLRSSHVIGSPAPQPGAVPGVARIGLVLTNQCNLRCKYCFLLGTARAHWLDGETVEGVVEHMLAGGPQLVFLHLFGGEPTLCPREIDRALSLLERSGVPYLAHLSSNGTAPVALYRALAERGVYFSISSDGLPEIQDRVRPDSAGRATSRRVEECLHALARSHAPFMVRSTLGSAGAMTFRRAMDYWADLGVRYVHFEAVHAQEHTKGVGTRPPEPDLYIEQIIAGLDRAEDRGLFVMNSAYMNLLHPTLRFCTLASGGGFLVNPDHSLSACYRVQSAEGDSPFVIGRWDSGRMHPEVSAKQAKVVLGEGVESFGACTTCEARFICAGGCPQRNYAAAGSWSTTEPWSCGTKRRLVVDAIVRMAVAAKSARWPVVCGYDHFAQELSRRPDVSRALTSLSRTDAVPELEHFEFRPQRSLERALGRALDLPQIERGAQMLGRLMDRSEACL